MYWLKTGNVKLAWRLGDLRFKWEQNVCHKLRLYTCETDLFLWCGFLAGQRVDEDVYVLGRPGDEIGKEGSILCKGGRENLKNQRVLQGARNHTFLWCAFFGVWNKAEKVLVSQHTCTYTYTYLLHTSVAIGIIVAGVYSVPYNGKFWCG